MVAPKIMIFTENLGFRLFLESVRCKRRKNRCERSSTGRRRQLCESSPAGTLVDGVPRAASNIGCLMCCIVCIVTGHGFAEALDGLSLLQSDSQSWCFSESNISRSGRSWRQVEAELKCNIFTLQPGFARDFFLRIFLGVSIIHS